MKRGRSVVFVGVLFFVTLGCWDARADTAVVTGLTGTAGGDLAYLSHQAFTFTFDFDPTLVGPGAYGVGLSDLLIGGYKITGTEGYIVGNVLSFAAVSGFRYHLQSDTPAIYLVDPSTGSSSGYLEPYFIQVQNGATFTLSFATQVTPIAAWDVQSISGNVTSFTINPESGSTVSAPEPSTLLLLVMGLGGLAYMRLHFITGASSE